MYYIKCRYYAVDHEQVINSASGIIWFVCTNILQANKWLKMYEIITKSALLDVHGPEKKNVG